MGVDFSLLFRPPLRAAAPKLIATGLGDLGSGSCRVRHASTLLEPISHHRLERRVSHKAIERKLTRNLPQSIAVSLSWLALVARNGDGR